MIMSNLERIRKELGSARREKIKARAAQLIAEEMTLRELRHARKITQVQVAKTLRISQDGVSRLEKRSDLLLSTLRKTVEAMGGRLSLVAEFPDRKPVVISNMAAPTNEKRVVRRRALHLSRRAPSARVDLPSDKGRL